MLMKRKIFTWDFVVFCCYSCMKVGRDLISEGEFIHLDLHWWAGGEKDHHLRPAWWVTGVPHLLQRRWGWRWRGWVWHVVSGGRGWRSSCCSRYARLVDLGSRTRAWRGHAGFLGLPPLGSRGTCTFRL